MNIFEPVDGADVLLSTKGLYETSKLYRFGDDLYASTKRGYVQLKAAGLTSSPHGTMWKQILGANFEVTYQGPRLVPVKAKAKTDKTTKTRSK